MSGDDQGHPGIEKKRDYRSVCIGDFDYVNEIISCSDETVESWLATICVDG